MQASSLRKYARKFKLLHAPDAEEDQQHVARVVRKHFAAQRFVITEEELLVGFIKALRGRKAAGQQPQQPQQLQAKAGLKKSQAGARHPAHAARR